MEWFLYYNGLRDETVKELDAVIVNAYVKNNVKKLKSPIIMKILIIYSTNI